MDAADKAPRRFGSRYIPESGDVPPGSSAQKSPQTGMRGSRSAPIRPEKIPANGDFTTSPLS